MSDSAIQAPAEPDPSATSIGNDHTMNEVSNPDATTDVGAGPSVVSDDATKAAEKAAEGMRVLSNA